MGGCESGWVGGWEGGRVGGWEGGRVGGESLSLDIDTSIDNMISTNQLWSSVMADSDYTAF